MVNLMVGQRFLASRRRSRPTVLRDSRPPKRLRTDDGDLDFEADEVCPNAANACSSAARESHQHQQQQRDGLAWARLFLSKLDSSLVGALKSILTSCSGVTTAYSGAGFFESLVMQLATVMQIQPPQCWHAGDIGELPRRALLAHEESPMAPQCVFGDLTRRVRQGAVDKMYNIQKNIREEFEIRSKAMPGGGSSKAAMKTLMKEYGDMILDHCDSVLEDEPLFEEDYCYRHRQVCPVVDAHGPTGVAGEGFTVHVAGSTCVDFSNRGSKMMNTGEHVVVFAVWASLRKVCREALVLHECKV